MPAGDPYVLALDAGTTGVRTLAVDADGHPGPMAYREFPQHFPRPGWVEHDADDILAAALATLAEVASTVRDAGGSIAAIGITNQRETVVAWDRRTGRPRHRAIVWQDRRTAPTCDRLRAEGHEPLVRARTGLILDPYFSATKIAWLLTEGGVDADEDLAVGTVDTWLLWNLTGGRAGGVHATEPSNASRTLLYDIGAGEWSAELADLFGVPRGCLPFVGMSSGRFGVTVPDCAANLAVPVSGIAGDQQASLFGQACVEAGQTKNTYGTGSFVLMNVGETRPEPVDGLLTTVAWQLGDTVTYALEGAVFVTGAAIQWLRDGLGILGSSAEAGPLAESVPDTGGVMFVPALTGLGAPYWDPYARGVVVGLTRGTTRAHLVRAAIEAMAWQTRDVVDAMTAASGGRSRRCASTVAPASWTCCARSRPTCSAPRCAARRCARRPPSAQRSSPGSPRACGAISTTSPPTGTTTAGSPRPPPAPTSTRATPSGTAPSTAPRAWADTTL